MIESKTPINDGDALKFVSPNGEEISVGVGGVEKVGDKHYVVYSKHSPHKNDIVYKTVDAVRENILCSVEKKLPIDVEFYARPDCSALLKLKCQDCEIQTQSMFVCDQAQNQALTFERLKQNIDRFNDTPFKMQSLKMDAENVFLPQSRLNELRRQGVEELRKKLAEKNQKPIKKLMKNIIALPKIQEKNQQNYMIVSEQCDIASVPENANLIYAPQSYDYENISSFLMKANELGHNFVYLNLPNVANSLDIQKLKNIITELGSENIGVVANNLYGMCFAQIGFKTMVGYQMNVANTHTAKVLEKLGAEAFTKSIEQELVDELNVGHTFVGKPTLMTFCHCPYKTIYNYNSCKECEFNEGLQIIGEDGKAYKIRRIRNVGCYFELVYNESIGKKVEPFVLDIRDN